MFGYEEIFEYGGIFMLDGLDNLAMYEKTIDMEKVKASRNFLYRGSKRVFDIFCALIGIICMIPIMIVVKLIYVFTGDFNSIFYTHTRIGKNGKRFELYKFRTMVPNSKEILEELLKDPKYKEEWDKNQKFENDPRITKAGKILRKTSLDELPQMFCVECAS